MLGLRCWRSIRPAQNQESRARDRQIRLGRAQRLCIAPEHTVSLQRLHTCAHECRLAAAAFGRDQPAVAMTRRRALPRRAHFGQRLFALDKWFVFCARGQVGILGIGALNSP